MRREHTTFVLLAARLDIVGMGCHAGLNSVQAAANWAHAHPGKLAIGCAVEVCSAHYLWTRQAADDCQQHVNSRRDDLGGSEDEGRGGGRDGGMNVSMNGVTEERAAQGRAEQINHAIVNSLFSDGAFAAALLHPSTATIPAHYAALHDFASLTAVEEMATMEYRWHQMEQQWWFHLSETAPYAVGAGLHELWTEQLHQGLPLELVRHVVMHTGGQTVIDAATAALGLDLPELEGTVRALKRYGNNSSASFMFAFVEFLEHPPSPVSPGDLGVFLTMGPGAGLELCLWTAGTRSASPDYTPLAGWEPGVVLPVRGLHIHRIADPV